MEVVLFGGGGTKKETLTCRSMIEWKTRNSSNALIGPVENIVGELLESIGELMLEKQSKKKRKRRKRKRLLKKDCKRINIWTIFY